jgi:hypothetical protein
MPVSGISSAGFHAASQQAMQALTPHQHGAQRFHSNTDVDATGSSVATAASSTGKTGSKVDITV